MKLKWAFIYIGLVAMVTFADENINSEITALDSHTISVVDSVLSDSEIMLKASRKMKLEADALDERIDSIETIADSLDDLIEDIEEQAEKLEKEAIAIKKKAAYFKMALSVNDSIMNDSTIDSLVLSKNDVKEREIIIEKLENSADILLIRSKKLYIKARELKELKDKNEADSYRLQKIAEELNDKSEEMENIADSIFAANDTLFFAELRRFKIGKTFSIALHKRGDYYDVLGASGFTFGYRIMKNIYVGIENAGLSTFMVDTTKVEYMVSVSPVVSFIVAPSKRIEIPFSLGANFQRVYLLNESGKNTATPFVTSGFEYWILGKFSVESFVKLNYSYSVNGTYAFDLDLRTADGLGSVEHETVWAEFCVGLFFHF